MMGGSKSILPAAKFLGVFLGFFFPANQKGRSKEFQKAIKHPQLFYWFVVHTEIIYS
jgi:hypothetical protein